MSVPVVVFLAFIVLAFGVRTVIHLARTGDTGFRHVSANPVEIAGGALFVVALLAGLASVLLDAAGALDRISALGTDLTYAAGLAIAFAGMALVLVSQLAMGRSWRIGVDENEKTDLVTDGIFRFVRNPIFSGMIVFSIGLLLMVPNALSVVAAVALLAALELQVRRVEEPYLLRAHGDAYRRYAARTGRFIPYLGRLPDSA